MNRGCMPEKKRPWIGGLGIALSIAAVSLCCVGAALNAGGLSRAIIWSGGILFLIGFGSLIYALVTGNLTLFGR